MSAGRGRGAFGWAPIKGGVEVVYKRFDRVVLDALAAGVAHMVRRQVSPETAVDIFMKWTEAGCHHPQAAELMGHLAHIPDRQIKRALLKRLRAVQQASNKQR
jgi:hypothetical protein